MFLNGCSLVGIPWPISVMTTVGDVVSVNETGKSLSENAASRALKKDCQWSRLLLSWNPCLTKEEFTDKLMKMDCDVYAWDFLNIPYCRE
tara:strand:+ start:106 stop:375 length:270 start_codon:yes stop_codon:yes gene_type:complete